MKTFFRVFLFPTGAREGALLTQKKSLGERQTEEKFEWVTSKKRILFSPASFGRCFPPFDMELKLKNEPIFGFLLFTLFPLEVTVGHG